MVRLLFIVSRTEPARYAYLKHVFGQTFDVIYDRRVSERRQRQEQASVERRREDRRQRDLSQALKTSGWVPVH